MEGMDSRWKKKKGKGYDRKGRDGKKKIDDGKGDGKNERKWEKYFRG